MPTAVKEIIQHLIIMKSHSFLDLCISKLAKYLKSFHFLDHEIESLNIEGFDFPIDMNGIEEWIHEKNKTQYRFYAKYFERI